MKGKARTANVRPRVTRVLALLALVTLGSMPAAAQEPFRIGLVALPGAAVEVEGLAHIKAAYSSALGLPVEVFVARDYAALAQAQIDGRLDYAVYSAMAYSATMLRCNCLVPLTAPVDADGATGLRSVLIVQADGPGADGRLAVGPTDSLATRLVPLAASAEAQRAFTQDRLIEAGSAAQALAMFVSGEVDGFFGWVPAKEEDRDSSSASPGGTLAQLAAAGLDTSSWRVVWRSDLLRYGPHAVRDDLPVARMKQLEKLLTGALGEKAEFGARLGSRHGGGFAPVNAGDYAPVEQALGALSR